MRARTAFAVLLTAAAALPLAAADAPRPLASAESNLDGVIVDLMSVERKGSVLTVKWAARNTGAEETTVRFGMCGNTVTTYAVDEENGTKYFVLTDKDDVGLASEHEWTGSNHGVVEAIPPGESRRFWMKLPAPPPEVEVISLFFTGTEPIEGVAITDRE